MSIQEFSDDGVIYDAVQSVLPPPSDDEEPPNGGWKSARSPKGKTYYFHEESGERVWDAPPEWTGPPSPSSKKKVHHSSIVLACHTHTPISIHISHQ